jgi:hypothetical protein
LHTKTICYEARNVGLAAFRENDNLLKYNTTWQSLRASHSFLCQPKEKKRRVVCATPLQKGSQATENAPFGKVRNRRGKNSLPSNRLPLHPAPDLAARLSGNGLHQPRTFSFQKSKSSTGTTLGIA